MFLNTTLTATLFMLVFDSAIIQSRNNRPICFKNANPRRSHEERVNKHVTLDIFQYQLLDTISHQSEKNTIFLLHIIVLHGGCLMR